MALHGNDKIGWDWVEVERFADKVPKRGNKLMCVNRASGNQLTRRTLGQAHLLFGGWRVESRQVSQYLKLSI